MEILALLAALLLVVVVRRASRSGGAEEAGAGENPSREEDKPRTPEEAARRAQATEQVLHQLGTLRQAMQKKVGDAVQEDPRGAARTVRGMMNRKGGFTIVELMVVVAILAILAGLLMAAASGGGAAARETACVNQVGQLMKAWRQCVNDAPITGVPGMQGFLLPRVQDPDGKTWVDMLLPYLGGSDATLHCPAATGAGSARGYGMNPLAAASWTYANGFFGQGFLLTPGETRQRPLGLIAKPAETAVLCDSATVTDATKDKAPEQWEEDSAAAWKPYVAFSLTDTTSKWATSMGSSITHGYDWGNTVPLSGVGAMGWDGRVRAVGRHRGACVTGFADAHAAAVPVGKLVLPQWGSPDCLFDNQLK